MEEFSPPPTIGQARNLDDYAAALDSLHIQQRPPVDVVDAWTHARREALQIAAMFRAIQTTESADHAAALSSCQSSFLLAPTSDGWTIPRSKSTLRRCHRRLCPVDSLAAKRKQSIAIDRIAERLNREGHALTFATLKAPALSIAEFWDAWRHVHQSRPYRRLVNGAFVGVHLSRGMSIHAHAVLAGPDDLDPAELAQWWNRACRTRLDRPGSAWSEPTYNPAAAITYAARPARAVLLDDPARLPELFALVKGKTLTRKSGIVAEYWDETTDPPEVIGDPIRYAWQYDSVYEAGEYDITP